MIRRNTWVLLAVFVVLLVVLFFLQQSDGEAPVESEIPTVAVRPNLFTFSIDQVAGFRIENLDGVAVEAEKAGEVWRLIEPDAPADEVDQSRIQGLLAQLTAVRILNDSEINASLSAMQLQYPPHRLTIDLAGGETVMLKIGASTISNSGLYVQLDGAGPVLASKAALDSFKALLDTPPLLPTPVPTIEPEVSP